MKRGHAKTDEVTMVRFSRAQYRMVAHAAARGNVPVSDFARLACLVYAAKLMRQTAPRIYPLP